MLDPGAGKTKKAYVWGYARGVFDPTPGVIYEFCLGRGAQYPIKFLQAREGPYGGRSWQGTLVRDEYAAYESVLDPETCPGRVAAGCLAHARRKYADLAKAGASPVAEEALRRIAAIYKVERELASRDATERLALRKTLTQPLWDELHVWLQLERGRVADGGATAKALDYSLNHWTALTRNLLDGEVPVGRVEMWRGGRRSGLSVGRPFRLAVPEYPRRSSVSTSPSSNRTCRSPASGSLPTHQAFAFERSRAGGSRRISPNFS